MANKQASFQRSAAAQELAESFLSDQLGRFAGADDPRNVVLDFLDREMARKEERSRVAGFPIDPEAAARIRRGLLQTVRQYMSVVIKVTGRACDLARTEFPEHELRVIQVRTEFDFQNWLVKALFVIDAEPEKAPQFRRVLNGIEYNALTGERFVVELDYLNRRTDSADMEYAEHRYPFVERFRTRFTNPTE
jgi:hypothetical protein